VYEFYVLSVGPPILLDAATEGIRKEMAHNAMNDEHMRTRAGFLTESSSAPSVQNEQMQMLPSPNVSLYIPNRLPVLTLAPPSAHQQFAVLQPPTTNHQTINLQQAHIPSAGNAYTAQDSLLNDQNYANQIGQQSLSQQQFLLSAAAAAPTSTPPSAPSSFANDSTNPIHQFLQAIQMMAAAMPTAQTSSSKDPDTKMAKNLDDLRANPTPVLPGVDNRCDILHEARFMGGPVCSLQKQWLGARKKHGLNGITPLASYDFDSVGIAGCITSRGLFEMHNPANPHLKLKYFSSSNVGSAALSSRRITLADNDQAVDINESLRDLVHMADFKAALSVAFRAFSIVLPWNYSVAAIFGFMENSNYCAEKTQHWPDRAAELTAFVDYVFHSNSRRWVSEQPFLTSTDLRPIFESWIGSRPAGRTVATGSDSDSFPRNDSYPYRQRSKGKGWYNHKPHVLNDWKQHSGAPHTNTHGSYNHASSSGQSGQSAGQFYQNYGTASGSSGVSPQQNSQSSLGSDLCKRFNSGFCRNNSSNCTTGQNGSGYKLLHKCSYKKRDGRMCREDHPECKHR